MTTPSDDLVSRMDKLEKRVTRLEKTITPAKKTDPSVGVYYRDGKPLKRKPRNE
jgi:hypothetical protein